MTRLIKRYGNRKLYDTQESRYVTLDAIAGFVKAGEEVRVVDNDSHDDLTAVTFAQIILEEERRKKSMLPLPMLRQIIQQGEATLHDLTDRVDRGVEAIGAVGSSAGKRVQELVERGAPAGKAMLEELLQAPYKRLEAVRTRIDEGLKQSVERITSLPAVRKELARIERSIEKLEERMRKIRDGDGPPRG